jgi:AcrR family transcriptional regulator
VPPVRKPVRKPARKPARARARPKAVDAAVARRVARRDRRRERSREEIVAATRAVLARRGVAGTTLDEVAREVGLTKAALYYYYRSKDALLFDVVFAALDAQARAVHDAVAAAPDGGAALAAIIRETVRVFAGRLDDFRIAYLLAQLSAPGDVKVTPADLARIRPLNDLSFEGTTRLLAADARRGKSRCGVEPRLMAFLASVSAIGLLTMKGAVESVGDPLRYSDEQMIDALARIFAAAAAP